MTTLRGLGHIPDLDEHVVDDLVHRHVGKLLGAAPIGVPAELDHSSLLEHVPDQGGTSSCVGQAFATSIYLRAKAAGHPILRPSPKAIYDGARLYDDAYRPLVDMGSRPRAAVLAMQTYGLVDEARWPLTEENVNDPPTLDVYAHGLGAMLAGYYRIASGEGAAVLLRQALAQGFFPAFAMNVDADYEELAPGVVYDGLRGPILGGHMQCLCGYGQGYFTVAGSWGPSFADRGFARVSDSFVESSDVSDLLVPTVVPAHID